MVMKQHHSRFSSSVSRSSFAARCPSVSLAFLLASTAAVKHENFSSPAGSAMRVQTARTTCSAEQFQDLHFLMVSTGPPLLRACEEKCNCFSPAYTIDCELVAVGASAPKQADSLTAFTAPLDCDCAAVGRFFRMTVVSLRTSCMTCTGVGRWPTARWLAPGLFAGRRCQKALQADKECIDFTLTSLGPACLPGVGAGETTGCEHSLRGYAAWVLISMCRGQRM